jgi:DNA-binding transcriptional LysR family regulator
MNWDDLKLFLAVARLGSIRAAAQEMGVNQSTVNRRLECLEHALKVTLFDATTRGHVLTPQGQAMVEAATPMQIAADTVVQAAHLASRQLAGSLKITAPQAMFQKDLAPLIAEFHHSQPGIHLHYDDNERILDLLAGEADIAFRAGWHPPDARLWSTKLQDHPWAVYCSPAYAALRGKPERIADIYNHDLVRLGGLVGIGAGTQWFMDQLPGIKISGLAEGVNSMQKTLMAGLGVGLLPHISGEGERSGLTRCFDLPPEMNSHMWLVTTHALIRDDRVKAFVALAKARISNVN